ncbi:MAG: ATP-binding protein [Bacilli bacterium]|nr:ATP-binding protein [Bacilli bacterium]
MIGKIVSIKNGVVYVNLSVNIYQVDNLIGKNVTFADRYIGEIGSMSATMMEVNLVGEIVNGKFIPGNLTMPPFGSPCRLTTNEEINVIYGVTETTDLIKLGNSYIYRNYPVYLNVNSFFSGHFAIFGNSGSGKSYFVSRLLQGIFYDARRVPINTNIFLFDAYGEYQQAFDNIGQVNNSLHYRVFTTNLKETKYEKVIIPFWFLTVDDLCLLLDADDARQVPIIEKALKYVAYFCSDTEETMVQKNDIIARCILDVIFSGSAHTEVRNKLITILSKFSTNDINLEVNLTKGGWTRSIRQCIAIDETGKFADIELVISYLEQFCSNEFELTLPDGSFMYSISDFYNALEFALISEGVFSSNKIFDYANVLKIRLNSLINSDYVNYFNCDRYMNKMDYLKFLLFKDSNTKFQVVNFNINYVDDRFAKVIVKIYSKILFDYVANLQDRASVAFHIVLEEAHRYVQNDIDTKIIGYNIFDRIAKEGRKYGILLGIISQRPSEISETTVSQCSNFAIFKMFNHTDIRFVEETIPGISDMTMEKIKILTPGNCMLFGTAFKMPILTAVDKPNPTPHSDSCDISKTWYVN